MIGAYAGIARHVAKSAESNRTSSWALQSLVRTGRPGVRVGSVRREGQGHRQFLAANPTGHKQDDQSAKSKLPAESRSRILDQSLEPTRVRSSRNRPLE